MGDRLKDGASSAFFIAAWYKMFLAVSRRQCCTATKRVLMGSWWI
ncbi:hypothetical protein Gotur_034718 [Gossypium turneri]